MRAVVSILHSFEPIKVLRILDILSDSNLLEIQDQEVIHDQKFRDLFVKDDEELFELALDRKLIVRQIMIDISDYTKLFILYLLRDNVDSLLRYLDQLSLEKIIYKSLSILQVNYITREYFEYLGRRMVDEKEKVKVNITPNVPKNASISFITELTRKGFEYEAIENIKKSQYHVRLYQNKIDTFPEKWQQMASEVNEIITQQNEIPYINFLYIESFPVKTLIASILFLRRKVYRFLLDDYNKAKTERVRKKNNIDFINFSLELVLVGHYKEGCIKMILSNMNEDVTYHDIEYKIQKMLNSNNQKIVVETILCFSYFPRINIALSQKNKLIRYKIFNNQV